MSPQPATKRSVALVIAMAAMSVLCLAIATRAHVRKGEGHKAPSHNFLIRYLDLK